ncbi:P-loop containing nucleoside triphosphate hydrolase protein [Conidiobolus coronatus NRRL 28638]|uniref:Signal recognition particle receptor subunit beta n=1 Tax=Conidiobolus coronatus (strain ATCC 28846 / CBS 209.66 / NRRL 28638) TaxID=796925 RepID=A0A137P616_CONC2|nr:P-loop containing nucleoside triphosphate hydrolase protein [Conidiobolus coronatus NRRL 28638]|eukprot:KXN70445.1 P-loop containing nucleoside triphosphate hydrolase protein [Conidiobolus coronatus NRRL 28638]
MLHNYLMWANHLIAIVAVITVLIAVYQTWLARKKEKNVNLFIGLPNSGKSSFFSFLRTNTFMLTHTSYKSNQGYIQPKTFEGENVIPKAINIVDCPGSEQHRHLYKSLVSGTDKIYFFIDSSTVQKERSEIGELLYEILSNPSVLKKQTPLYLVCNKQDLPNSVLPEKVEEILEAEINSIRQTIGKNIDAQGSDETNGTEFLGFEGKSFKFNHLTNTVRLVSASLNNLNLEEFYDALRD